MIVLYWNDINHRLLPLACIVLWVGVGLERCGKSCRLRWINYLRPDLKRGSFSQQEEDLIINLHKILGNRYNLHI